MKTNRVVIGWLIVIFLAACAPRVTVVSATASLTELSISTSQPEADATQSITSDWNTYTSALFLVSLKYPAHWEINHEGNAVYRGKDGFFQLSATNMSGLTAKEMCELEIQHNPDKLGFYRYGTKPTMEILQVDNQPACIVVSSEDQLPSERGYSLLVVEYPELDQGRTRLLFFSADKNHMLDFIGTLKFVR